MRLKHLDIRAEEKYLNGYGQPTTRLYVGTVKFEQERGNIEILLTEEQIKGIVALVGDSLIDATKGVAVAMSQSIMEVTQTPVKEIANDRSMG